MKPEANKPQSAAEDKKVEKALRLRKPNQVPRRNCHFNGDHKVGRIFRMRDGRLYQVHTDGSYRRVREVK